MITMLSREFEPVSHGFWRPFLRQLDEMFDQQVQYSLLGEQGRSNFSPSYEMDETNDHYVMSFDVPGVHREDLTVELTGQQLVVSGERKSDGSSTKRRIGKFQRTFTLPIGVSPEEIIAEHKDGVLRLAIKKPDAARATSIKISDGSTSTRNGGFFKSLMGEKKGKESVEIKGASYRPEPVAIAN